jgi:hypothetical protein
MLGVTPSRRAEDAMILPCLSYTIRNGAREEAMSTVLPETRDAGGVPAARLDAVSSAIWICGSLAPSRKAD